jgi:hypothetical protein
VTLQDVADASAGNHMASSSHANASVQTTGKERYLFFNRPLVPYMHAMPAEM